MESKVSVPSSTVTMTGGAALTASMAASTTCHLIQLDAVVGGGRTWDQQSEPRAGRLEMRSSHHNQSNTRSGACLCCLYLQHPHPHSHLRPCVIRAFSFPSNGIWDKEADSDGLVFLPSADRQEHLQDIWSVAGHDQDYTVSDLFLKQ